MNGDYNYDSYFGYWNHFIDTDLEEIEDKYCEELLYYYKQDEKKYVDCVNLEKTLEIATCMGNISILNDEVFAHTHVVLADHQGHCYGGHLMPGSVVFACEYVIQEFLGDPLCRSKDDTTGLMLWGGK